MRTLALRALLPAGLLLAVALAPPVRADDDAAALAERYAPIVVVRDQSEACGDGEPYLPSAVDSVLGRPDVILRGPSGESIPAPQPTDLAGRGEGWYLDLPGNPLEPGCDYERWFDASGAGSTPTVYARVATDPDHPGSLVLQYWFWWVFNDWNDRHEGDWEMVQLQFDAETAADALARGPTSAAFAQHEGSETADWADEKLLRQGDRIVVYPGQGSHAAYYTQARWFGKSAAAGFGCDETGALGAQVRPEVVMLPDSPDARLRVAHLHGPLGREGAVLQQRPDRSEHQDAVVAPGLVADRGRARGSSRPPGDRRTRGGLLL